MKNLKLSHTKNFTIRDMLNDIMNAHYASKIGEEGDDMKDKINEYLDMIEDEE